MEKVDISKVVKNIKKELNSEDIEFFLAANIEINKFKRSRKKIIAAVELLHSYKNLSEFVFEFYLKNNSGKFRSVAIISGDERARKYAGMRLVSKEIGQSGYLNLSSFKRESRMRARFVKELGILHSTYFSVSSYGIFAVDSINSRRLTMQEISMIKIYLRAVVWPVVELAIDNERNFNTAIHDHLTGVYNRGYLMLQLKKECSNIRDSGTVSMIMIDLDNFKKFNDSFGHPAGDKLLKTVSAIFLSGVRRYDVVGRYGGEEFLIILPGASIDVAKIRAEQLVKAVYNFKYNIKGMSNDYKPSISIGVANIPYNASNETEIIEVADKALYLSKTTGKNKVSIIKN